MTGFHKNKKYFEADHQYEQLRCFNIQRKCLALKWQVEFRIPLCTKFSVKLKPQTTQFSLVISFSLSIYNILINMITRFGDWALIRDRKTIMVTFNVFFMERRGFIFMINFSLFIKKSKQLFLCQKEAQMSCMYKFSDLQNKYHGGFILRLLSTIKYTPCQIFRNPLREN